MGVSPMHCDVHLLYLLYIQCIKIHDIHNFRFKETLYFDYFITTLLLTNRANSRKYRTGLQFFSWFPIYF